MTRNDLLKVFERTDAEIYDEIECYLLDTREGILQGHLSRIYPGGSPASVTRDTCASWRRWSAEVAQVRCSRVALDAANQIWAGTLFA